jgi:two-component system response regulator QseB
MRILLVEDNQELGSGIQKALSRDGNQVDWLTDGQQALTAVLNECFELIILDLHLPSLDGIDLLRKIRAESINTPVLIMTARDSIDERVLGLDNGADDYVVKPVDLKELRSRIRAVSRRSHGISSDIQTLGLLRIEVSSRQVWYRNVSVDLSRREFSLLMEFASRPDHVLTREFLDEVLYGWDEGVESNAVEVHIHHLRKKLETSLIKTVRGVGYKMVVIDG